jgi:hypothetical protein
VKSINNKKRKQITSPENSKLDKKSRHYSNSDTKYQFDSESEWSEIEFENPEVSSIGSPEKNITFVNKPEPKINMANVSEIHNTSMNTTLEGELHSQSQNIIGSQLNQPHHQLLFNHTQVPMYMSSPAHLAHNIQQPIQSVLTEIDIQRITTSLKMSLSEQIEGMVKAEVSKQIIEHVAPLQIQILHLQQKVDQLETEQDNNNQYSRKLCVLIGNIPEAKDGKDEDTEQLVMNVAEEAEANISRHDIENSHRMLRRKDNGRPRDVIVKFTNYKAKKEFMKGRKKLRDNNSSYYINEQLTARRREIAYQCRQLKKNGNSKVTETWSYDGNIYIKCGERGPKIRIISLQDLVQYGYIPPPSV